jgi:hypothetical protein
MGAVLGLPKLVGFLIRAKDNPQLRTKEVMTRIFMKTACMSVLVGAIFLGLSIANVAPFGNQGVTPAHCQPLKKEKHLSGIHSACVDCTSDVDSRVSISEARYVIYLFKGLIAGVAVFILTPAIIALRGNAYFCSAGAFVSAIVAVLSLASLALFAEESDSCTHFGHLRNKLHDDDGNEYDFGSYWYVYVIDAAICLSNVGALGEISCLPSISLCFSLLLFSL